MLSLRMRRQHSADSLTEIKPTASSPSASKERLCESGCSACLVRKAALSAKQESHAALRVLKQRCFGSFSDRRRSRSTIRERGCAAHVVREAALLA